MTHAPRNAPAQAQAATEAAMAALTPMALGQAPARPAVPRRRALLAAAIAGSAALLAACASLLGARTVEISRDELQARLARQFPTTRRLMKLLDVSAAAPRLTLWPDQDRISAVFDLNAKDLILGQDYQGNVGLSFGLRYEPRDTTIRLTRVKVEHIHIDGLPPAYQRLLTGLGAQLAESSLQDQAVHQFKPEDLRSANRLGYQVGEIRVTAQGLSVQLTPRP